MYGRFQLPASHSPFNPVWLVPLSSLALTQVAVLATSISLPPRDAHGSLRVHPVADVVFRTILWITTSQRSQQWVAVTTQARSTFTDREGDPHSPKLLGFWRVQLLNAYTYARGPRTLRPCGSSRPTCTRTGWIATCSAGGWLGVTFGIVLTCLVLGFCVGLAAAALHGVLYVFVAASAHQRARALAGQELHGQHGLQLGRAVLGDGRGEPPTTTTTRFRRPRSSVFADGSRSRPGRSSAILVAARLIVVVGSSVRLS